MLTGGSGFIGRNILESFLTEKHQIFAPRHQELDMADSEQVDGYFRAHRFDFIIHSAEKPGHRNAKDLNRLFFTNTRMFFNLARHAEEVEWMIVVGSGAIYDMRHYLPRMKEEYFGTHVPVDEHGFTKYVCEKYVERAANILDLRVFGIFGKYEDYAIRFISNMICKALYHLPLTIKQDRRFDFLYVNDLMPVLDHFLECRPRFNAYNVTPNDTVHLKEVAQRVLSLSGEELPIVVKEPGLGLEYSGDNSRLREEMPGFKPTPFDTSLRELYQWYSDHLSLVDRELLLYDK